MDSKKTKTIYQLDTPFTTIQWPQISPTDQETIVELLCSTISPIGTYRSTHITPSKGKRSRKRKRRNPKSENETSPENPLPPPPPPPEISSYIVTGLNSIHRMLEESSKRAPRAIKEPSGFETPESRTSPGSRAQAHEILRPNPNPRDPPPPPPHHFSSIFIANSNHPPILTSHLPHLVATATNAHPTKPPTILIPLPKGSEMRIATALNLPRVSCIGILNDAPNSTALVDFIRGCVGEIEIPWLDEVKKAEYLETRIRSFQTTIGEVKK
ncbi:hypothetical protein DSL72_003680 [Monilinia vaccinii-corymbosi]|uniref:Uncharacterized protein n=1 Tax=Monilinia vaccinii-corymbosi TaxID=61207 RepID=A0A8A3P863_9HELO|nr:hypothetical protein DSL72_003680 [Monilinia vaccinii-corymbosi]